MVKIGLVLSGGGVRCFAHIGVLQYLIEIGINPSIISGTSAGSLVGAFYAAGYRPQEILHIGKSEKFFYISNLSVLNGGLFNSDVFQKITKKYIPHETFESLQLPLYVSVTDLTNAKLRVFNEGPLHETLKASCSVPLMFQPVLFEESYLTDGGILDNFPVEPLTNKCDKIIGVFVNALNIMKGKMSYFEIIERTVQLVLINSLVNKKQKCDVYIEPPQISNFGVFDSKHIDEIYAAGYNHAKSLKTELLNLLE